MVEMRFLMRAPLAALLSTMGTVICAPAFVGILVIFYLMIAKPKLWG